MTICSTSYETSEIFPMAAKLPIFPLQKQKRLLIKRLAKSNFVCPWYLWTTMDYYFFFTHLLFLLCSWKIMNSRQTRRSILASSIWSRIIEEHLALGFTVIYTETFFFGSDYIFEGPHDSQLIYFSKHIS